jgi:hypothetical protein
VVGNASLDTLEKIVGAPSINAARRRRIRRLFLLMRVSLYLLLTM